MIAAVGAWFLKNPLAGGLGILALVLGVGLGVQTLRHANVTADLATEKLAFANFKTELAAESLRVTREAAAKSAEQVAALTAEVKNIGLVGAQAKTEIRYVQSNNGPCTTDPVYRATVGSVQRILDAGRAGGDQGSPRGGPAPTVR